MYSLPYMLFVVLRYMNGKRIRDACIYPYKINVAQYYP